MKRWILIFLLLPGLGWANPASAPETKSKIAWPTNVSEERLGTEVLWPVVMRQTPPNRPRVILVLGGGGARGLSHIGVLRVLEEERIPIDQVVGVSVGALIGALYAGGVSVDQIQTMSGEVGWNSLTNYSGVGVMRLFLAQELFSTKRMETYLEKHIPNMTFADLKIPFACVATDIRTGDRVVFQEGPVAIAARASATIPGVFHPVEYRQRLLVDGGLVDNLPTDIIERGPNDIVIAVLPKVNEARESVSSVLRVLIRSIEIQKGLITKDKKKMADFVIEPDLGSLSLIDLSKTKECIEAGTRAARVSMLPLKKLILKNMAAGQPVVQESRK